MTTATTARPSPLPMKPSPSVVVALTEIGLDVQTESAGETVAYLLAEGRDPHRLGDHRGIEHG